MWWASKKDLEYLDGKAGVAFDFLEEKIKMLEKRIAALEPKKPDKPAAKKKVKK